MVENTIEESRARAASSDEVAAMAADASAKETAPQGVASPEAHTPSANAAPGFAQAIAGHLKPKSKALGRQRAMRWHRAVRFAIQVAFFIIAPAVFSAAFNGVKYIFTQLGAREAIEPGSFVVLLAAVLAFTVVFGRFFCGYACAFGTLGDAVYALFTPLRKLLRVLARPLPAAAYRAAQLAKFAVLAAICGLCFVGAWSQVSGYSPWTAFAAIVAGSIDGVSTGALCILAVIVVGMAFIERFFCRFLCPLGALFSLMPVLPFSAFSRKKSRCAKNCGLCKKGCPVAIFPDSDSLSAGECIACGRCADGCPLENVALVRAGTLVDVRGRKKSRFKIKGTGVAIVLVKAALLLAVLWIAGAIAGIPAFSEVTGVTLPWQS